MAINTNNSTGLSQTMQTYYDRKLILDMEPKLVHYQYGQPRPLPENSGKVVDFRKWTPFAPITKALTEGTVPDGQTLTLTNVTATVESYGDFVSVTDVLDLMALDPVVNDSVELMAQQGAESIDEVTAAELHKGTNVIYANGKAGRAALIATDVLTTTELRKAVRTLKKNKAPQFMRGGKGYYVAILGPDAVYDLQNDPAWQDVAKYQDKEALYSGEIGTIFGVIVTEIQNSKIVSDNGAAVKVASSLIFGKNAYGVVSLGGGNVKTIVKTRGSAGTSDPLDQFATVGWKVDGFAAKVLQAAWLIRIEHGISA